MASVSSKTSSNGNDLILYHYCTSYYSQKVVIAFQEKRLKYKSHQVNLFKYEQYEPWYMRLNPNGQVPVLKDGVKIIPGSARIIEYLEDNFSNGDTPRLLPEKGTQQANRVQVLKELLDKVPIEIITLGCTRFQELTTDSMLIPCIRKIILAYFSGRPQVLKEFYDKNPDLKEHYNAKRNLGMQALRDTEKVDYVKTNLDYMEGVLDEVDRELATHAHETPSWWLCSERFSVADITLAVLLNRLHELGLSHRYWGEGRRLYLAEYFQRVQGRDSVKFACRISGQLHLLLLIHHIKKNPVLIITATSVFTVVIGLLLYWRYK